MADEQTDQGGEEQQSGGEGADSDRPDPYQTGPVQKDAKPEDRPEPYKTRDLREADDSKD